jgi:predicted PurR-regulated permease PerM
MDILEIVKELGSMGIVVFLIFYIGKPLIAEIKALNTNVVHLIDKVTDSLQFNKELADRYVQISKDILRLKNSIKVAFRGSNVESYNSAADILEKGDEINEDREG